MTRALKTLGLIVSVVLAMSAGGAPVAKAVPIFEAEQYPATIEGTGVGLQSVFSLGGVKFTCNEALHLGQMFGSATALTLAATYEECTWTWPPAEPPKHSVVPITMNGCDFRLHSLKLEAEDEYLSLVDLECPAGKQVVIDMYSEASVVCRLTLPAQSKLAHVRLIDQTHEEATKDDVKAQITIEKLHYTQDLLLCPAAKQGTFQNLQYVGVSTLVATNQEGQQIGFRVVGE